MQHTNTHARYFHKCGGGDWQTKSQEKGHTPRQTRFLLKSGVELWCLLSSANKRSPHAVILSLWHSHSLISHNQTWIIIQPRVRATHCLAAFLKSIRPLSSPLLIYTTACTRVCVRLRACACVCVCVCVRETQPSACWLWALTAELFTPQTVAQPLPAVSSNWIISLEATVLLLWDLSSLAAIVLY